MSSLDFDFDFCVGPEIALMQESEPGAELLERRWFAALAAMQSLRAECDVLLGVIELAENSWRQKCAQAARIEGIKDALGEQLAALDGTCTAARVAPMPREIMSAA